MTEADPNPECLDGCPTGVRIRRAVSHLDGPAQARYPKILARSNCNLHQMDSSYSIYLHFMVLALLLYYFFLEIHFVRADCLLKTSTFASLP